MNGNDCLRRVRGVAAGVACVTLLMGAASVRADSAQLETKSYTIPSGDPGIDLFIRNKHQAGAQQYGPDRILLFVHGATYPAETAFDLPIEGVSMMDLFAQQGYDVYLVDVREDSAKARWLKGVAEDKKEGLIPPGVFEQWADATWVTDPESTKHNPPMLRVPNGVLEDVNNYFAAGKPPYDPGKIAVPTFLIHAEWDADLPSYQAQEYFTKLTNAPYRRFVELSEGTHTVMLEKNRMQFFREILNFLNEERPLALK